MKRNVILDTGPLVALLNRREARHAWSRQTLKDVEPPLLTCEAVVSEACFLLRGVHGGEAAVMAALTSGLVRTTFELSSNTEPVAELIQRFASVPMSLADACLVRMAELYPDSVVLTFDRDFEIYRKNRGEIITVVGTREVD